MPDFEAELQKLRDELTKLSAQVIRNQVMVDSLVKSFDKHVDNQRDSNQRVPNLLLAIISAVIMGVGVLAQLWIARGP